MFVNCFGDAFVCPTWDYELAKKSYYLGSFHNNSILSLVKEGDSKRHLSILKKSGIKGLLQKYSSFSNAFEVPNYTDINELACRLCHKICEDESFIETLDK